jgi:hypothetical protein
MKTEERVIRLVTSVVILGLVFSACGEAGSDTGAAPVNTALLEDLVSQARTVTEGAVSSADGTDVPAERYWVRGDIFAALQTALAGAETTLADSAAAQHAVDAAAALLQSRIDQFKSAKRPGLAGVDTGPLSALVEAAGAARAGTFKSADGTDVPQRLFWVRADLYANLETAIAAAEGVLAAAATQTQVDAAKTALEEKLMSFNAGKQPGLLPNNVIPAGLGIAKNSVNTTPFRQNSIVTHGDTQYIAYFADNTTGSQSPLVVGKRTLGEPFFTITTTAVMGWTNDAHNSPCIMTDGDGFLHVVLGHHNSALSYYKSTEPGSTTLAAAAMIAGANYANSVTYPEFYRLPSGDLLFVYRNGGSGDGFMVLNKYDHAAKTWSRVHDRLVYGSDSTGTQSPYWQIYLDANGRLHLSWVFRRSSDVRTNHDMYYAYSDDEGRTWRRKSDGAVYAMPITPGAAEKVWDIGEDQNLMNQTSMTADEHSNPYIATYWGRPTMQYRVIYHDGTQWKMSQVSNRTSIDDSGSAPYLSGGGTKLVPIARPRLVTKQENGKTKAYYIFRDQERGWKVSMYSTADITGGIWTVRDLSDFSVYLWEPSHDTELWKNQGKLHIFVQYAAFLADGSSLPINAGESPKPVYCLEAELD